MADSWWIFEEAGGLPRRECGAGDDRSSWFALGLAGRCGGGARADLEQVGAAAGDREPHEGA
jgi:hypothetical protein